MKVVTIKFAANRQGSSQDLFNSSSEFAEQEEIHSCNLTSDRKCQCKKGTYIEENSPEHCQKCTVGCPIGKVQASPCTSWHDLKCVPGGTGTRTHEETTVSGKPVSTSLGTSPSPTAHSENIWKIVVPIIALIVLILSGFRREHEVYTSTLNEALGNEELQIPLGPELETEGQQQAGAIEQSPGETQPLQGSPGAEGFQMKRILVPANDANSIETLKSFFDYFINIVPYDSWNKIMRKMGLSDNEIEMARNSAECPAEKLYKLLMKWLHKTGKGASVNVFLDALEATQERNARETIQDHLVNSGKYIYEEKKADSL
ncbi:PREDICTED: tumor necrosis factor receptor superfamily member 10A [Elephantulus edwardii]|uniref:tumor necrosis factor receptor superfamily member 10A n=1 Tax=Elephantulus edwardii TaxID=28737 RepID=UPI0003F09D9A|nr:PREDICTED: tumor necrosis factor receptor superfamily member 10A [Elephantulus edwardii]